MAAAEAREQSKVERQNQLELEQVARSLDAAARQMQAVQRHTARNAHACFLEAKHLQSLELEKQSARQCRDQAAKCLGEAARHDAQATTAETRSQQLQVAGLQAKASDALTQVCTAPCVTNV